MQGFSCASIIDQFLGSAALRRRIASVSTSCRQSSTIEQRAAINASEAFAWSSISLRGNTAAQF